MNDYATEEEQIDAIKQWWSENGKFVIGGVILGVAGLIGWNQYSSSQRQAAEAASEQFSALVDAAGGERIADVQRIADALRGEFGQSTYAAQSELILAGAYVERGEYEPAITALRRLVGGSAAEELRDIGRLRLSSLLLHLEQFEEARELISSIAAGPLRPQVDELLGDIEAASGNYDAARLAYESAQSGGVENSEFLSLKLQALPLAEESAE